MAIPPRQQVAELISAFSVLANKHKVDAATWNNRQLELFEIAQALAEIQYPTIQRELTDARREVMRYVALHQPLLFPEDVVLTARTSHRFNWQDIQITPEVFFDVRLKGTRVPRPVAKHLIKLHRMQVRLVVDLILSAHNASRGL